MNNNFNFALQESKIKILTNVDLASCKTGEEYVQNLFSSTYRYLESLEDYERAAEIKIIENEYKHKVDKDKVCDY